MKSRRRALSRPSEKVIGVPFRAEFAKWFHLEEPAPVDLTVRNDEDILHNLAYLNSYVHDAATSISKVRMRGRRLAIGMDRDRWELLKINGELDSVRSSIVIEPVLRIDWTIRHGHLRRFAANRPQNIVEVRIELAQPSDGGGLDRICFLGPMGLWRMTADSPSSKWRIRLRDLTQKR